MKPVVIFDIDGTIADHHHRLPWILDPKVYGDKKQWTKFHELCSADLRIASTTRLLDNLRKTGHEIWLFTGRPNWTRQLTELWLHSHGIEYEALEMRDDDDYRHDVEVKKDMAAKWGIRRVEFVVEDRTRCVEMWREMGLCCLQCAPGDY